MVSYKDGVVFIDRHICGESLAIRWSRDVPIMRYVADGRLKPFGLIGRDQHGNYYFTQHVDIPKPVYQTDKALKNDGKFVCFDMDEVEAIEKIEPVKAPPPPPTPAWATSSRPTCPPEPLPVGPDSTIALAEARQRIAELELELAEARKEIAHGQAEGQAKPPRTAGACDAAQASRVEEWKSYATVMAKTAYQCGLEDKKDVTRNKLQTLAEAHGGLSSTALDLLRDALPDVVKKTAGAPKQG